MEYYIYELGSKKAGLKYIGMTGQPRVRKKVHFNTLGTGLHMNFQVQAIWDRYRDLEFSIVSGPYPDRFEALVEEDRLIRLAIQAGTCLNLGVDGDTYTHNPRREENLKKLSKGMEEWHAQRTRIEKELTGSRMSTSQKERLSNLTQEERLSINEKMSAAKQKYLERIGEEGLERMRTRIQNIVAEKCSMPVVIHGVAYSSLREASRVLGINYQTLGRRCRSGKARFSGYEIQRKDAPKLFK